MRTEHHKTSPEYIKRIAFTLDFIEKNLEADLSLETVSQKAHYSAYHFHRVFVTLVGEPLNQYVTRKRVERIAAILLTNSESSIKELAYNYGFNSESSFSRTFKKYYGLSPSQFKSEGKSILSKNGIDGFSTERYIRSIDDIKTWIDMNAQLVITELQEIRLAGIMHIGDFNQMGDMYQRLMTWGRKQGVLDTNALKAITIYHDNPNVTQTSKVRFSACVTINQHIEADGEIRPVSINEGLYAVGRFEIKGQEIARAWKNSCIWVLENGYEFRDGDYFEIYHNEHTTHPQQKFILDICIPLVRTKNIQLSNTSELKPTSCTDNTKLQKHPFSFHELIQYMKELSAFFKNKYEADFTLGTIYQGNPDYSYFSLTTQELKKQKLKFVIILDHTLLKFSICLSGQNKAIRKTYWNMFKTSDWRSYHVVDSIDGSLSIVEYNMAVQPDFEKRDTLTTQIEAEALAFINELRGILE